MRKTMGHSRFFRKRVFGLLDELFFAGDKKGVVNCFYAVPKRIVVVLSFYVTVDLCPGAAVRIRVPYLLFCIPGRGVHRGMKPDLILVGQCV